MVKKRNRIIFNLALTIFFIIVLIIKFDLVEVLVIIKTISIPTLIIIAGIYLLSILTGAYKWNTLIRQYKFTQIFQTAMIGRFFSFIFPGQILGEAAKAYYIANGKKDSGQLVTSIIVDKITGVIGVLLVGLLGVILARDTFSAVLIWPLVTILIILLFIFFVSRLKTINLYFTNFLNNVVLKFPKTKKPIDYFIVMLEDWRIYAENYFLIIYNIVLAILFQLLGVMLIYFFSLDFNIGINFFDYCWIFSAVSIGMLLPITIGGLGVREGIFLGLLGVLGVSADKALALSLSLLFMQLLDAIIGGLIFLKKMFKSRLLNNITT